MINTKVDIQTLRKMDDVSCTNIVTVRNIKKLIKKYPSLTHIAIDCWVCGGHYTTFECNQDSFVWYAEPKDGYYLDKITGDEEDVTSDQLNKLIVHTYRTMWDNLGEDIEFIDTPEELLAYAEQKLQQMLKEESA